MAAVIPEGTPALEVRGLRKRFHHTLAVDGLDLTVAPGEMVGLIGPNGAGKSTTVKVVTGQLLADEGEVRVAGRDVSAEGLAARELTGYVPQTLALYPFLTGREVLTFVADVRGLPSAESEPFIDELLQRFRLTEAQHRMTREYSDGMARKLSVASALLGAPPLMILDESLTGLDPRAAAEVKAVLRERVAGGTAVLLVSHILEALERLCSRIVLIDRGQVISTLDADEVAALVAGGRTLEDYFLEHTAG